MTDRLVTRRQVNEMYGFSYCGESYRRWEDPERNCSGRALLMPIQATPVSRVYYRLSNVIAVFGPVPATA